LPHERHPPTSHLALLVGHLFVIDAAKERLKGLNGALFGHAIREIDLIEATLE
jgi:hypothetical protein